MSRIHYFQRYSSIENTVTNNTLQLLGRIYGYSASAASRLLSELTGEAVYIGIDILQQNKSSTSIPDGTIIQNSFKIAIEAKVDAPVDLDQLRRHASSFGMEALRILLLITKSPLAQRDQVGLSEIRKEFPGIALQSVTYEQICDVVGRLFKPHEESIIEIVDDYIEYCNDSGLFDQSRELMRIVPCGRSGKINEEYQIYFQPSDRGYTNHAFIGIYYQKAVHAVLDIKSVFDVTLKGDGLSKVLVQGEDTSDYDESIRSIIEAAKVYCGYEIAEGHRFFCGVMVETEYRKASPGGIQGARFVNLKKILGAHGHVKDIAEKLREATWE